MNSAGQKVYYAVEENDCCEQNICGSSREFEIKIIDIHDNELIHLSRRYACQSCFFPCCLQVKSLLFTFVIEQSPSLELLTVQNTRHEQ